MSEHTSEVASAVQATPVSGTASVKYSVEAYEQFGRVFLRAGAQLPDGTSLIGTEDQVDLIQGPIDPNNRRKNRLFVKSLKELKSAGEEIDTGIAWGSGYNVGYFAMNFQPPQAEKWFLVAVAGTTRS